VIVAADGKSLTYQPDHDFFGNEEFTYTIESTISGQPGDGPSTGKVFVSVTGVKRQSHHHGASGCGHG